MGHIAANHSTWDLELENLSVESLLLIYADFRVKSGKDERGKETVTFYSLAEAFDVILGKLDNVDEAKEKRYRKVYTKLRDFENYMIELGVDCTVTDMPTEEIPELSPKHGERALMSGKDTVDQIKFSAIEHNIKLMSVLQVDSELADLIEAARSEEAWKNVRTYVGILAEYSTYMTERQKLMTLKFLYELLAHKDGDIRMEAAEIMGEMIAAFSITYKKELPEGVILKPRQDNNMTLAVEYIDKIINPERRFTEQHRRWMHGSLGAFMVSLIQHCQEGTARTYIDMLTPYFKEDSMDEDLSVVLLTTFETIPVEECSGDFISAVGEYIERIRNNQEAALPVKIAALKADRHMDANSDDELYYSKMAMLLGYPAEPDEFNSRVSEIFLDDLKMGTHWLVKVASIELMRYYLERGTNTSGVLHLGTHLVNILKVNERLALRRTAGDTLLSLIPKMPESQRNEMAVELYNGLEVGERKFAKYVPYYMGKMSLSLPPAEFDEVLDTIESAALKANSKVAGFMVESLGVILENFKEFENAHPDQREENQERKIRLEYLMIKAYSHYDSELSREAFRCIGQYIFASTILSQEDKDLLFAHSYRKLLMLLDETREGTLDFYSNAAVLNHIYRYISAREQCPEPLRFPDSSKVCFYPGTFDPFSLGHKAVAMKIRDMGYDVYLAVDEFSWSKHTQPKLLRRQIVNMSMAGEEGIYTFPDDIPINIANNKDVRKLKGLFAGKELYLAVGSDVVDNASAYHLLPNEDSVHSLNHIIFERETRENTADSEDSVRYPIEGKVVRLMLDKFYEDISSTRIRENIDLNRDISNIIDPVAQDFIYEHNMYLREPTYKHVIEARELEISPLAIYDIGVFNPIVPELGDKGRGVAKIGVYLEREDVHSLYIKDNARADDLIACAACTQIGVKDLFKELGDKELAARVRNNAAGDIASIGFIFAREESIVEDAAQMIVTELLSELISMDFAYAIYRPVDGMNDPLIEKALIKQGFINISPAGKAPVLAVNMKSPVVVFKDVETVIKAPFNKDPKVIQAIEQAHDRLLKVLANIYPGKALLSFNTGAIQNKIIGKMAELNGVSTVEGGSGRGPLMAVPFGKALGDVLVPNTVTKTLVIEKYFNRIIKGFSIAEAPNNSPLDTQVKMIKSFDRPVVLIDDLLHTSHRMNKLAPILRENKVDVEEVLIGVITGSGMDKMEDAGLKAESAYYLPTMEIWLNERDCYPYIGGDSLEAPAGERMEDLQGSAANLVLPYIKPSFIGDGSMAKTIQFSEVALSNSLLVMRALEDAYQREFERKLTIKRLGEVVTVPRIPAVDKGIVLDENIEPSNFIKNDMERLIRLKWGTKYEEVN